MSTKPVRIPDDLFDAAAAAGRRSSRSAAQQVDYWARLGQQLAIVETLARDRVLAAVRGQIPLADLTDLERAAATAEIDAAVEHAAASTSFADRLAAEGVPTITVNDAGELVRRDPDGTSTTLAAAG